MRIHRLSLSQVKGVAEREIHFPDGGVVVVEGENEAGKTTMIEALDLLFDEKDSSRKKHVLAMRPVGLDVPTAVEVEATSGPYRFTYRKQWFRKPGTVLTVTAPRRENLTGSAAHDRAKAILEETTDLDLWRALRLMQATPLNASDLSGSTALADALEAAAGQATDSAGAEGDSLVQAAEEVYREFFTPTGRPKGEYRDAELRVAEARRLRDEAALAVREVADDVARHGDTVAELARLQTQLAAGENLLEQVRGEWESTQEIVRESERRAVLTRMARQAFDTAAERVEAREAAVAEVVDLREAAAAAAEQLAELRSVVEPQAAALSEAVEKVAEARAEQRRARQDASRAEADIALLADLRDLASSGDRLRRLDAAEAQHRQARAAARAAHFTGSLPKLEQASNALALARAEWRAGSAGWTLTPESDGLEVVIDGEPRTLAAETAGVLDEVVEIHLPGVARLRLTPAEGGAERSAVVERAESALADLLAEAGVADLAEARDAAAADEEAGRALRDAERALDLVLGGDSAGSVRERAEQLSAHVADVLGARAEESTPESEGAAIIERLATADPSTLDTDDVARLTAWVLSADGAYAAETAGSADRAAVEGDAQLVEPDAADHDEQAIGMDESSDENAEAADSDEATEGVQPRESTYDHGASVTTLLRGAAAAARAREAAAEGDIAAWEAEVTIRRAAVDATRVGVARAEVADEAAAAAVQEASARLARARERVSDHDLASQVHETRAELNDAVAREQAIVAEVDRHDPESLKARLAGAESAATSLRRRHTEARDERVALEARLRHAGEQGRAERLSEAESALARAERAHASLGRRARAARTLYETLVKHRTELTRTYVEPFGKAVSRLGRVVYGPEFDVEVGPSLQIEARLLGETRIPYEALSSGAKEQMSILTRLACASLVDPEQGAPVILDDALGYSDPARLQRICAAFSLVGGGSQVILLTCTPGRYAAIPDAHVIRI